MPSVTVEPELYERVIEAASSQKSDISELTAEAIRRYLWELDRIKISDESRIYRQRHAELKSRYLGEHIAMRNGEVVDHDADFQALRERILQRFGRAPVMMTLVGDNPGGPTLLRHGFRQESVNP